MPLLKIKLKPINYKQGLNINHQGGEKGFIMKKTLLGLTLLTTMSSFAGTKVECYEEHYHSILKKSLTALNIAEEAYTVEANNASVFYDFWDRGQNGLYYPSAHKFDDHRALTNKSLANLRAEISEKISVLDECLNHFE